MYMVYWTEMKHGIATPHGREFDSADMALAMKFMEALRAMQRAGEGISFVTMASENPHSVGHAGVSDPHADYDWKKRRK
jgi:hypothetical protein